MTLDFTALLTEEMEWAIAQKRSLGIEKDFTMRATIIGPTDNALQVPIAWRDKEEQRKIMLLLSETCKRVNASAIMFATDARYLLNEKFCAHFGLEIPTPETLTAFNQERWRIMESYDHDMGKLPREFWAEALNVMVAGPTVSQIATTRYHVEAGNLLFKPTEFMGDKNGQKVKVSMIPPWWQ